MVTAGTRILAINYIPMLLSSTDNNHNFQEGMHHSQMASFLHMKKCGSYWPSVSRHLAVAEKYIDQYTTYLFKPPGESLYPKLETDNTEFKDFAAILSLDGERILSYTFTSVTWMSTIWFNSLQGLLYLTRIHISAEFAVHKMAIFQRTLTQWVLAVRLDLEKILLCSQS